MLSARFRALTANSKQIRTDRLEAQVALIQRRRMIEARKVLQRYPPPIPTSNYVRTFALQRGWKVSPPSSTFSGLSTTLYNDVRYAGFVQGPEQQELFQGRWTSISDVIDRGAYISELRAMMRGLRV